MKKLLLSSLIALGLVYNANSQSVFTSTSYSDNFNDNAIANTAEDGWYNDAGVYTSVSETGGKLNVVCNNADQYFNGFGLYLKPTTKIDVSTNKKVMMTVTNPSTVNSIKVRCDLRMRAAAFTGPNCPVASGDTISANAGGVTNVITIAPNTTQTITFDYTSATAGYEYNTVCGGAWTPTTYTIPAAAWTDVVGLYMVINGGAGEGWCGETDGSCTKLSGTVLIEDLKIGTTAVASVNAAEYIASSKLFPNPVSDIAKIEMDLKSSADVKVTVSDMMGKEIMTVAEGTMSSLNTSFDVSNLKKGVYSVNYSINGSSAKAELLMVK